MKCADKVAYKTRGEAYDFAKKIRIRSGGVYIYECSFCRQYHITNVRPERWRYVFRRYDRVRVFQSRRASKLENERRHGMTKSYNDIKEQEQRVMALCLERGRWCDNAKKRFDKQHLAQITQNALMQHGFPIFGQFDKDEKRAFVYFEPDHNHEPVNEQDPKPEPVKDVRPTPTEKANERVTFEDWMSADERNRKKIQDACRHAFVKKMYAELLTDMEICKLEGWDVLEFPRMLKQALKVCFPKPV